MHNASHDLSQCLYVSGKGRGVGGRWGGGRARLNSSWSPSPMLPMLFCMLRGAPTSGHAAQERQQHSSAAGKHRSRPLHNSRPPRPEARNKLPGWRCIWLSARLQECKRGSGRAIRGMEAWHCSASRRSQGGSRTGGGTSQLELINRKFCSCKHAPGTSADHKLCTKATPARNKGGE